MLAFDGVNTGCRCGLSLTKGTGGVCLLSFVVCFPKTFGYLRIFEPSCQV